MKGSSDDCPCAWACRDAVVSTFFELGFPSNDRVNLFVDLFADFCFEDAKEV